MPGTYGNQNLYRPSAAAFISYTNSSESVTLPVGTAAVMVRATTKCWIKIGEPGETATAAAPSGEKVWVQRSLPLNADEERDFAVSPSTDAKLVQIAVIRDASDGVLDIVALME